MRRSSEEIKKEIVDQLYWDNRVDASEVTVDVHDGVVTLGGKVPTYSARTAAVSDARIIPGVVTIENNIRVEYPPTFTTPADSEIQSNIENVLRWNPDIDSSDIIISVDNGWVTLEGSVEAFWKKVRAEDIASDVTGVLGVTNKLSVVPTKDVVDEAIADDIVDALDRNTDINIEDIDVEVENGMVTLSGIVPTWTERLRAYEAALYTDGVLNIHDELTVG
jgi:osmotically-inducible protein OsmY